MKKLTIALTMLAMVATAHAYIWNVTWTLGGGYAESPLNSAHGVLEDFSVTWSLLDGSTPLESMPEISATSSGFTFEFPDSNGNTATYNSWLEQTSGTPTYVGSIDDNDMHTVYQHIFISNGTSSYEWTSAGISVQPTTVKTPPDTPTPLFDDPIVISASDWTPVSGPTTVPEPATMSLLGLGALAMVLRRKVRK